MQSVFHPISTCQHICQEISIYVLKIPRMRPIKAYITGHAQMFASTHFHKLAQGIT